MQLLLCAGQEEANLTRVELYVFLQTVVRCELLPTLLTNVHVSVLLLLNPIRITMRLHLAMLNNVIYIALQITQIKLLNVSLNTVRKDEIQKYIENSWFKYSLYQRN